MLALPQLVVSNQIWRQVCMMSSSKAPSAIIGMNYNSWRGVLVLK
jgi:hypothetical protein